MLFFALISLTCTAKEMNFLDYCTAQYPGQVTEAEAISTGYLKLALKYKGPMPFKISTRRVFGENGEIIREMDGVSSFFWYAHPEDFNNKFSSTQEIKNYLLEVFKDKSKCEAMNLKLQTKVENLELSMPPITGKRGEEIPFKLTTLSPINGATKLKRLYLLGHDVSGNGMGPLNLPNLEELKMTNSGVEDLTFIRNLKGIKILFMGKNKIKNINAISDLTALEDVELYDNKISDISPFKNHQGILFLSLGGNYIEDISPLKNLVKLNFLSVQSNRRITGEAGIKDVSALSGMVCLRELNIRDNKVTDISPLSGLSNMVRLNVSRNQIEDCAPLDTLKAHNANLVVFNLHNNCK